MAEEEGCSSPDEDGPAPGAPPHAANPRGARYSCNDSNCSSQEDASTGLGELELALARDLIQENLSRSQALDKMAELQFHDLRRPQPGRRRNGQASITSARQSSSSDPGSSTAESIDSLAGF